MTNKTDKTFRLVEEYIRRMAGALPLMALIVMVYTGTLLAQDEPATPEQPGFGLGAVEIGIGIAPLGLTGENDIDVITEYGGFVTIVSRNPDGIMLRLSGMHGTSRINTPAEVLSEGPVTISRFDASILYGSYFYAGAGFGIALLDHSLGARSLEEFAFRGQRAEESFENTTYYVLRAGVRSEGRFGYFVEGVLSIMETQVHTSVTDLPTGLSAARTTPFDFNIFHFFHLGLVYRF